MRILTRLLTLAPLALLAGCLSVEPDSMAAMPPNALIPVCQARQILHGGQFCVVHIAQQSPDDLLDIFKDSPDTLLNSGEWLEQNSQNYVQLVASGCQRAIHICGEGVEAWIIYAPDHASRDLCMVRPSFEPANVQEDLTAAGCQPNVAQVLQQLQVITPR